MTRLIKRFGLIGLIFFTVKGLAWLALAGAAGYMAIETVPTTPAHRLR